MDFLLKTLSSYPWSISEFLVSIFIAIWGMKILYNNKSKWFLYLGYYFSILFTIASIIILICSDVPKISSLSGFCLLLNFLYFCFCAKSLEKFGFTKKYPLGSIILPSSIIPLLLVSLPVFINIDFHDWGGLAFGLTIWFWYPKAVLLGALVSLYFFRKVPKISSAFLLGSIAPLLINLIFLILLQCWPTGTPLLLIAPFFSRSLNMTAPILSG